jgi:hypothetical protein
MSFYTENHIYQYLDRDFFYQVSYEILENYHCVPYHSRFHGLDVMTVGIKFLKNSKIKLNKKHIITFIFGLLSHDIFHPGLHNLEELNNLKRIYHYSESPVEEFHYLKTKEILKKNKVDFDDEFLKNIIYATDISRKVFSDDFKDLANLIKLADVNHTVSSFEKHLEWTWKLEDEIKKKLTYQEQVNFLEKYVEPILEKLKDVFEEKYYQELSFNLKCNIDFWKSKLETENKIKSI